MDPLVSASTLPTVKGAAGPAGREAVRAGFGVPLLLACLYHIRDLPFSAGIDVPK